MEVLAFSEMLPIQKQGTNYKTLLMVEWYSFKRTKYGWPSDNMVGVKGTRPSSSQMSEYNF